MPAARAERMFDIDVGATVAERYRLERLLGRGGMGEVWVARHANLDTPYAIKFLDRSLLDDNDRDTILKRFSDEARASSALCKQSRHIVSVHDYGEQGGIPFLVMELLVGESLDECLETRGPKSPEEALTILTQVARALGVAHKAKLIHRDLKPGNVFLCRDEEGGLLVKVLDFGLVRSMQPGDKNVTQKGIAVGTPTYMSPEQARALPTMDHQCDLWSMAVLSYTMLAGRTPWPGETMQDVLVNVCRSEYVPLSVAKPELGEAFDTFYARAFQREAAHRYVDAEQLVEAFRLRVGAPRTRSADMPHGSNKRPNFERGDTTALSIPGVSSRERTRWLSGVGAGAAAALVMLGLFFMFRSKNVSPEGSSLPESTTSAPGPTDHTQQRAQPPPMTSATPTTPLVVSPSELPLAPSDQKSTSDTRPAGKGGVATAKVAPTGKPTSPVSAPRSAQPVSPHTPPTPSTTKPHDPSAVL